MIFAKTIDLVLSGRKTQTLRLAYDGDHLGWYARNPAAPNALAVFEKPSIRGRTEYRRPRWIVGHTYAAQRERCHAARGRIRVTSLTEVFNPLLIPSAMVHAEGFDARADFLRVWNELHAKRPVQRCWAIGFHLVSPADVLHHANETATNDTSQGGLFR